MSKKYMPGKHFLQLPGPSNVPDRILRAMDYPTIDHRGPEFSDLANDCLEGIKTIFKTKSNVIIYPASGTGAWEAALVNTIRENELVLMVETGHFASLWNKMALRLGIRTEFLETDWRRGVVPEKLLDRLQKDTKNEIKAVCVVHNETSTGCASRIEEVRKALNSANHNALLMVDTISGLASMEYKHDEWGVDITVSGSQKGLMLPPGLSFNAISDKALRISKTSGMRRSYWDWEEQIDANKSGSFPYTPATNLLYGLKEAINMLHEEGLDNVFKRHEKHALATRAAVQAWGFENVCKEEKDFSNVLTAVMLPENHNADNLRKIILENFNMSLGAGLSKLAGKVFRIGHLGDFNDLMLMGTLNGLELGFEIAGIPYQKGGTAKATEILVDKSPNI
jgi:alanine-glyoxylate transaminase/serine-glyoxylate transaminase/serine-pyruvate transaminase